LFYGGCDVFVYPAILEWCKHIVLVSGAQQIQEGCLKLAGLLNWNVAQQTMRASVEDGNLLLNGHGLILLLYEQLRVLAPLIDGESGDGIHVATELGKRF